LTFKPLEYNNYNLPFFQNLSKKKKLVQMPNFQRICDFFSNVAATSLRLGTHQYMIVAKELDTV
jgi:hypothetical protein